MIEHAPNNEEAELVGVLTLGNGARAATLTNAFPTLIPYHEALELNRLVLLDRIPANAESWFTSRALRIAAEHGIRGVTTFSDPSQFWQSQADGSRLLVKRGHVGSVYQALNMVYLGRSRPTRRLYFPDGIEISRRALTKILGREVGADGVVARLIARGAPPPHPDPDRVDWRSWLDDALIACGVQRLHHPGNHKYALRVGRSRAERTCTVIASTRAASYPKHLTL